MRFTTGLLSICFPSGNALGSPCKCCLRNAECLPLLGLLHWWTFSVLKACGCYGTLHLWHSLLFFWRWFGVLLGHSSVINFFPLPSMELDGDGLESIGHKESNRSIWAFFCCCISFLVNDLVLSMRGAGTLCLRDVGAFYLLALVFFHLSVRALLLLLLGAWG
jgi:hypothetical protein